MERIVTGQMRFGKSCAKCRSYFITEDEETSLCPWCQKLESGQMLAESYENSNQNL